MFNFCDTLDYFQVFLKQANKSCTKVSLIDRKLKEQLQIMPGFT